MDFDPNIQPWMFFFLFTNTKNNLEDTNSMHLYVLKARIWLHQFFVQVKAYPISESSFNIRKT